MKRHHPGLSWPQIQDGPMRVACHFCDTLQESPRLREGDAAYCCCCGRQLYRNRPHSLARAVSFSSAGLILMVIAHSFPFLSMKSGGLSTRLTLVETVLTFWSEGSPLLAVAVTFFTIFAPLMLLGGLLYISVPLRYGAVFPGSLTVACWFQRFEPWSMLEVFLLGILVSLLKLGHLAKVTYDTGLWALAGVVVCTSAAMAGIDRMELWDRLEIAQRPVTEPAA
ncbi:MAG: paraquat-inducible protein A [Verrucomicrobiaceae bacterium]|nr:MAG: paraquat-inducible protein A [Verrucomicrobiaceae bacterium]